MSVCLRVGCWCQCIWFGNMSYCTASSLYDHLDHCFVVFIDVQQSFLTRRIHVWENKINIVGSSIFPRIFFRVGDLYGSPRTWSFWCVFPWRTVTIRSHKSSAGMPSILYPAFNEMISDTVELCETEVCFLHIQQMGTNVWLPKMHKIHPDVDFESSRSPAKSESWHSPNLHCCAVFPTWQYCLYSHVWWIQEIKRHNRLSHALVHCVIDRASLFTDHRMSGLPMRAKYKHFWKSVSKLLTILQQIPILL